TKLENPVTVKRTISLDSGQGQPLRHLPQENVDTLSPQGKKCFQHPIPRSPRWDDGRIQLHSARRNPAAHAVSANGRLWIYYRVGSIIYAKPKQECNGSPGAESEDSIAGKPQRIPHASNKVLRLAEPAKPTIPHLHSVPPPVKCQRHSQSRFASLDFIFVRADQTSQNASQRMMHNTIYLEREWSWLPTHQPARELACERQGQLHSFTNHSAWRALLRGVRSRWKFRSSLSSPC
ncbi:hypothetical protein ACJ73_01507, partial [Blastomyces percursus]